MRWKKRNPSGRFTLSESNEIDAGVECVFAYWNRYELFPRFMDCVRHAERIDEQRVLWDIDVAGYQFVWEARIVQLIPGQLIRWESDQGAARSGEVRFDALPDARTRLTVEIEFRPQGLLESLGARFGLADLHVRRDLESFRRLVEGLTWEESTSRRLFAALDSSIAKSDEAS